MRNLWVVILVVSLAANVWSAERGMQTLALRWQKPAIEEKNPCGVTEAEMQQAMKTLTHSLKKSGMQVQLGYLKPGTIADPPVSGLWINGKPLENWLNAEVLAEGGCTTLKMADQSYRVIPAEVIVKAGMAAAEKAETPNS